MGLVLQRELELSRRQRPGLLAILAKQLLLLDGFKPTLAGWKLLPPIQL